MSRLIRINHVKFRNFLSFGNNWQEMELKTGLNLITGQIKGTGKSNGSGKSSLLSTICYGLYGKDPLGRPAPSLINYKNRKNLEVFIEFVKNNDIYVIHRGLSPNFLEVYENEVKIPDSGKRDMESFISNDILNIDYTSFTNLVYSNFNSSTPFLAMRKPEKRSFIEKMFNLEVFSKTQDECNKKISSITGIVSELESKILYIRMSVNNLVSNNETMKDSIQNSNNIESEIIELSHIEVPGNIEQLIELKNDQLDKTARQIEELKITKTKTETTYTLIMKNYDTYCEVKKELSKYNKKEITKDLEKYKNTTKSLKIEIDDYEKMLSGHVSEVALYKKLIKQHKNIMESTKDDICPTCKQNIPESLHIDNNSYLEMLEQKLDLNIKNDKSTRDKISHLKDKVADINIKISDCDAILEYIYRNEQKMKSLLDFGVDLTKKQTLEQEIEQYNKEEEILQKDYDFIINEINELHDIFEKQKRITLLNEQLKQIQTNKETIEGLINKNNNEIEKYEKEISDILESIKTKKNVLDYLNCLKVMLKDERIKQYAISSWLPHLENNINEYLSTVGTEFHLEIDKFLDASVRGPGIHNSGYENLSSGEKKCVDISIMLSFHNITKRLSPFTLDVMVFDEILDSSSDESNLEKIINIVRKKQIEDSLKIFVITHRNDINKEFDNIYRVEKAYGFSRLI
jgi:DNA repair exonuclease SbcCD ATPase subunit